MGSSGGQKIPIAIKFAFFITVLVVAFMGVVTMTAVGVVERVQEVGVNESGIQLVETLVATIDPSWMRGADGRKKLEDTLNRVVTETVDRGVLNVIVVDSENEPVATGQREQTYLVSPDKRPIESSAAEKAGVRISEFLYEKKPIRSFQQALASREATSGSAVGGVEVLISATRIQESKDAMRDHMLTLSALICAAAAIGSFILAALFAHPIRTLMKDLRQVSLGNLDHQSKVRSNDEIGELARTFNQMTGNLKRAQAVLLAKQATEHELKLATKIQEGLLPSGVPIIPGFEIACHYKPAKEIGGDYYDFVRIDDEHLGFVVADVSGKGVPGSLVMTMTRSLLRLAAKGVICPTRTVQQVNRALSPDMNPGMFVTLLYGVLHIPTHRLELVRAGHNNPLIFHRSSRKIQRSKSNGIALGLDRVGTIFDADLEPRRITLEDGDFIATYTDGVIEAKDAAGSDYSEERLARVLRAGAAKHPREIISAVLSDVNAHRGNAEQSDDITLVILKRSGPA